MSCMRELDFMEQTKYGSSTLKKKEKLLTAQLQMVFTRTEFGFRRRAKQHKMDTWEVVVILDQIEILTQKQKERRYNFISYPRTKQALFQKENQALFQASLQKES